MAFFLVPVENFGTYLSQCKAVTPPSYVHPLMNNRRTHIEGAAQLHNGNGIESRHEEHTPSDGVLGGF
ncbi:hypothetical protein SDJN02_09943, partial [Cucurbita argyrosperma subsp. argyrosperma]